MEWWPASVYFVLLFLYQEPPTAAGLPPFSCCSFIKYCCRRSIPRCWSWPSLPSSTSPRSTSQTIRTLWTKGDNRQFIRTRVIVSDYGAGSWIQALKSVRIKKFTEKNLHLSGTLGQNLGQNFTLLTSLLILVILNVRKLGKIQNFRSFIRYESGSLKNHTDPTGSARW